MKCHMVELEQDIDSLNQLRVGLIIPPKKSGNMQYTAR